MTHNTGRTAGLEPYKLVSREDSLSDQSEIKLQTSVSALKAIAAVAQFFVCAVFALVIAPLFPSRVKYFMINQVREVHSAFHIANKKASAVADRILKGLESKNLTKDMAFESIQKAKEEMTEGVLGQNFHNMDAIDFLDSFVDDNKL